jgi:hypothetical protein
MQLDASVSIEKEGESIFTVASINFPQISRTLTLRLKKLPVAHGVSSHARAQGSLRHKQAPQ